MTSVSQTEMPMRHLCRGRHSTDISERLTRWTDQMLVTSTIILLSTDAITGVYRYALSLVQLTALIYLPIAVAVATIVPSLVVQLRSERSATGIIAIFAALLMGMLISVLLGRGFSQVMLALYTWIPFFLGMMLGQRRLFMPLFKALALLFAITAIGVILNYFVRFPWVGATYRIGGIEMGVARQWESGGVSRLSGFSRASFMAADYLMFGIIALFHAERRAGVLVPGYIAAAVAMFLTTSKTPEAFVLLFPLLYLISRNGKADWARVRILSTIMLFAMMIGLPLASILLWRSGALPVLGAGARYSSLVDRFVNTWPNAVQLLANDRLGIEWLIGRGMGGIGTAAAAADPNGTFLADNLPLFLFLNFGVIGLGLLTLLLFKAIGFARSRDALEITLWLCSTAILVEGSTASGESLLVELLLGLICATAIARRSGSGARRFTQPSSTTEGPPQDDARLLHPAK